MSQDLTIELIGLGINERANLDSSAQRALENAQLVIGSDRQLETVAHYLSDQQRMTLPALAKLKSELELQVSKGVRRVAVLASGDPLHYGIGRWFSKQFQAQQLVFHPGVSSVQGACHRLGVALQDVKVLSLHGRPLASIRANLHANHQLLILTDKYSHPRALAEQCQAAGFADSQLVVLEQLGYANERVRSFSVSELLANPQPLAVDPLHVTLIQVAGEGGVLPEFPGIRDELFVTDKGPGKGLLTKREVRLNILSLLEPRAGDVIWDLGAGCGGVAVELARWQPQCQVIAVEQHPERFACLEMNRQKFGVVGNLSVIQGRVPEALVDLKTANKIFVGGSDGELPQLLGNLWQQLPSGGQLLVSAVMETSRCQLGLFYSQRQAAGDARLEALQLAVSKGDELAGQLLFRPTLPVALYSFTKH